MPEKKKAILLRIAPELWESLNRWAAEDLRSVNSQIEFILREAVRRREGRDAARPALSELYPWVRKLAEDLRAVGLTQWAQRVEVVAFGGKERQVVENLRATLGELAEAQVTMPEEAAAAVRGLMRVIDGE